MLGVFLQLGGMGMSNILQQLEDLGFFSYVLPFILIFAIVYAVLRQIKIFEDNKGATVLIAVSIGLLALQLNFVPGFFQTFFPKVGVAVALMIVALILAGAFISPDAEVFKWIFFGLGATIFIVLLILQFSGQSFTGSYWWTQYGALVIVALVIITALILVMVTSKSK